MAFEKIKNFFKELDDIGKNKFRGEKSYIPFISVFMLIPLVISWFILWHLRLNNNQEFLFVLVSVFIYICLIGLTVIKVEKYKQKYNKFPFEKFLKQFVKIENYFKNKKILQIFLSLLMLFIIFIVMCFSFIFSILYKSEIILLLAVIALFSLLFLTGIFIYDLILLTIDKFKKQSEQQELKEENNNE